MPKAPFLNLEPKKRQRIIDKARRHFADHGYRDSSYNTLLKELQCSKGAMYNYFDDKDDLYSTVLESVIAQIHAVSFSAPIAGTTADSYWKCLEAHYQRLLSYLAEDDEAFKIYKSLSQLKNDPMLSDNSTRSLQKLEEWPKQFLKFGQERGFVRDDLPLTLLVKLYGKVSEGFDDWMMTTWVEADNSHAFCVNLELRFLKEIFRTRKHQLDLT
jgi:TetR/AcrR family transcriptional regulator